MKKVSRKNNKMRGFTLVETIFYLTFLVILLGVVISFVISISKTYKLSQATKNLETSAVFSLERISREARNAISVDTLQSVLSNTTGSLVLNERDTLQNPRTVRFYLDNGTLKVDENGAYSGPLTPASVNVSQLEFRLSTSTNSQSVKMILGLSSTAGDASVSKNFYSTVVLRGSY